MPFEEAVNRLGRKTVVGSKLSSSEWSELPDQLRENAFFSATIENTKFLQRSKDALGDWLTGAREEITLPNGKKVTALKTGSRAQFVEQMRRFAIAEGMGDLVPEAQRGGLKDITSQRRLELVFDIQTLGANKFANWKQGMDSDVLDEFPAQRFIREAAVKVERPLHTQNEGVVRLKTDLDFWRMMNSPLIGGFGVPWGPWGFGPSGMGEEDVDRAETEALGLLQPGQPVKPVDLAFTDELKASTRGLAPELMDKLRRDLGEQVVFEGDTVRWKNAYAPKPVEPKKSPAPRRQPTPSKLDSAALDDLVKEYDRADLAGRRQLDQRALDLLEVPEAERFDLQLDVHTRIRETIDTAKTGAKIISRFVRPDLLKNLKIALHPNSGDRCFYRNREIHMSRDANASVAAHEIMHGVEMQNPTVLQAAAKFLLQRAAGEKTEKLSKLTGNRGYKAAERAYKDRWEERGGHVYAGKAYTIIQDSTEVRHYRCTEVLTMGIERLIKSPLEFYKNDRDWFDFLINTVRYP